MAEKATAIPSFPTQKSAAMSSHLISEEEKELSHQTSIRWEEPCGKKELKEVILGLTPWTILCLTFEVFAAPGTFLNEQLSHINQPENWVIMVIFTYTFYRSRLGTWPIERLSFSHNRSKLMSVVRIDQALWTLYAIQQIAFVCCSSFINYLSFCFI